MGVDYVAYIVLIVGLGGGSEEQKNILKDIYF